MDTTQSDQVLGGALGWALGVREESARRQTSPPVAARCCGLIVHGADEATVLGFLGAAALCADLGPVELAMSARLLTDAGSSEAVCAVSMTAGRVASLVAVEVAVSDGLLVVGDTFVGFDGRLLGPVWVEFQRLLDRRVRAGRGSGRLVLEALAVLTPVVQVFRCGR